MPWWQVVLSMLGSGVLAVLAKGWVDRRAAVRARKNELEDRDMEKEAKKQPLEEQFYAFRAEQKKENAELRQRMAGLESTIHTVNRGTRSLIYNDIRRDALAYVRRGKVDPEERIKLKDRWAEYVADYGDESLNNIMSEVDNLRV